MWKFNVCLKLCFRTTLTGLGNVRIPPRRTPESAPKTPQGGATKPHLEYPDYKPKSASNDIPIESKLAGDPQGSFFLSWPPGNLLCVPPEPKVCRRCGHVHQCDSFFILHTLRGLGNVRIPPRRTPESAPKTPQGGATKPHPEYPDYKPKSASNDIPIESKLAGDPQGSFFLSWPPGNLLCVPPEPKVCRRCGHVHQCDSFFILHTLRGLGNVRIPHSRVRPKDTSRRSHKTPSRISRL